MHIGDINLEQSLLHRSLTKTSIALQSYLISNYLHSLYSLIGHPLIFYECVFVSKNSITGSSLSVAPIDPLVSCTMHVSALIGRLQPLGLHRLSPGRCSSVPRLAVNPVSHSVSPLKSTSGFQCPPSSVGGYTFHNKIR